MDTKKTGTSTYFDGEYLEEAPSARDPFVVGEGSNIDSDRYETGAGVAGVVAAPPEDAPNPTPPAPTVATPPADEAEMAPADASGVANHKETEKWNYDGVNSELKSADEVVVLQQQENLAKASAGTTQGTLRAQNINGELIGDFPLRHTEVNAEISGYLARTDVIQEYTNPFREPIEAIYVFPLPSMAAIHDFVMGSCR